MSSPQANLRRKSALMKVADRKISSISAPVNLKALVKIYLIDGSSKTLQMLESSTALDLLSQLRFNLDLQDISTFALYRVKDNNMSMIDLDAKLKDFYLQPNNGETSNSVKILFRSWIHIRNGLFDKLLFQDSEPFQQPNAEIWLSYMEATFMLMNRKYYVTEEESLVLGCLSLQAEVGDYNPQTHSDSKLMDRVISRFPYPVCDKLNSLKVLTKLHSSKRKAMELVNRVKLVYARLAGD